MVTGDEVHIERLDAVKSALEQLLGRKRAGLAGHGDDFVCSVLTRDRLTVPGLQEQIGGTLIRELPDAAARF